MNAPDTKDRTAGGWLKAGFFFALGAMCAFAIPYVLFFIFIAYMFAMSQT